MYNKKRPQKPHVIIGTIGRVDHSKSEISKLISDLLKSQFSENSIENIKTEEKNNDIKSISLQKRR